MDIVILLYRISPINTELWKPVFSLQYFKAVMIYWRNNSEYIWCQKGQFVFVCPFLL